MPNDVIAPSQRYSDFGTEIPMRQSDKTFDSSQLEYDAWRDLFRSKSGRYYSEGIKPSAFTGWVRPVRVRGFTAASVYSSVVYSAIPGYDSEGNVVAVPDRDQSGPWQR